jgi:tripartite ATP-independent transporter DctM subunit
LSISLLTTLLILCVMAVFAAGLPVAFGLGSIAIIFGILLRGPQYLYIVATSAMHNISSFVLLAIPLFLFMGQLLQRSGSGEAMFHAIHVWSGRLRGGMAMGAVVVCTFMAAMVGVIGAGIMTMGTIAVPPMFKRQYDKHLALGAVMAGGALGMLIPPSVAMILYCSVTKISIGQMFAGGIIPGMILSGFYILYIAIRCKLNPSMGPSLPVAERASWKVKFTTLKDAILAFGLIALVLGSIFGGLATPTEAAAVGGVGAILISVIYRTFGWRVLKESSIETMRMTGMIVWITLGASIFTNLYMLMGGGHLLEHAIGILGLSPWQAIIMMQVSLILLGMIMDELIIVLITAPLYVPVVMSLGFDPVWFGVVMIVNMQIAVLTPPYGFALFYMKGVAPPDVTMLDLYRSIGPFIGLQLTGLILCMIFPEIILWLPGLVFGT